jgi:methylisocitrate lyase
MEDQVAPKKCGHIAGKQVVPMREFAEKIRAARSIAPTPTSSSSRATEPGR